MTEQTSFLPPVPLASKLAAKAKAPLAPAVEQRPCDLGLFSDARNQLDLCDLAKERKANGDESRRA